MPPTFSPQPLGKYTLLRKIATGGMAEVFLARASGVAGFQKLVVIKRILPNLSEDAQFVAMFLNEAQVASQLNHPNVVSIFELGESEGAYYLAMEHIDGPNLRALIRRAADAGRPLDVALVLKIISLACEGLEYAHNLVGQGGEPLGLIHRDVSPDNILVSRQGAVKVVDFGIAKAANQPHLTKSNMLKGKLAYMPPEQIRGHALDRRADVFALGVCLHEMLAGTKPFDATSEVAVMQAILQQPPQPITLARPELDPEIGTFLERALQKDRDQRYPSCAAFQADVDSYLLRRQLSVGARDLARLVEELMGPPAPLPALPRTGETALASGVGAVKAGTPPNFNQTIAATIAVSVDEAPPAPSVPAAAPEPSVAQPARQSALWPALAACVVVLAIGAAYLMGRRHEVSTTTMVIVPQVAPAPAAPEPPASSGSTGGAVASAAAPAEAPATKPAVEAPPAAHTGEVEAPAAARAEATEPTAEASEPAKPEGKHTGLLRGLRERKGGKLKLAASAAPAASANGRIAIRVIPFAEDVVLDGRHLGPTPLDAEPVVPAGRHHVTLVKGAEKREFDFELRPGAEQVVKARFEN